MQLHLGRVAGEIKILLTVHKTPQHKTSHVPHHLLRPTPHGTSCIFLAISLCADSIALMSVVPQPPSTLYWLQHPFEGLNVLTLHGSLDSHHASFSMFNCLCASFVDQNNTHMDGRIYLRLLWLQQYKQCKYFQAQVSVHRHNTYILLYCTGWYHSNNCDNISHLQLSELGSRANMQS